MAKGRCTNPFKQAGRSLKRKATQSGHEFMYMAMWGEEPPKKRRITKPKAKGLW